MPFENFAITQVSKNGKSTAAAISPDGKYILSVVSDKGKTSLWLRHLPTDSDTQIVAPSDAYYFGPIFTPDGNFIYFLKRESAAADEADLYRAPILGGTPQLTVHEADNPITFSPDGQRIAYVRTGHPDADQFSLLIANADGSGEKQLVAGPLSEMPVSIAWAPDGKSITAILFFSGDLISQVVRFDVASGKRESLAGFTDAAVYGLVWMPSGQGWLMTVQSRNTGFVRDQIGYLSANDPAIRYVTQDTNSYRTLRISADGKMLSAIQQKNFYSFYDLPASGSTGGEAPAPVADVTQNRDLFGFGWAPENKLYVNDGSKLLRVAANGAEPTVIFSEAETSMFDPQSCAGGKYAVFTWAGYHHGNLVNIWRVDADGNNPKQISDGHDERNPVCSPDGRWVYFRDTMTSEIKRAPVDGGKTEVVPGTKIPDAVLDLSAISVSPDSKWLAFLIHTEPEGEETAHQTKIVLLNVSDQASAQTAVCKGPSSPCPAEVRRIVHPDQRISGGPQFTPDGKSVAYPFRESGVDNLWLQPLDAAKSADVHSASANETLEAANRDSESGAAAGSNMPHRLKPVLPGNRDAEATANANSNAPRLLLVSAQPAAEFSAHPAAQPAARPAALPHEGHHDPHKDSGAAAAPAAVPGHPITNFTSDEINSFHWSADGKQLGVLQRHVVSDVVLLRDKSAAPKQ